MSAYLVVNVDHFLNNDNYPTESESTELFTARTDARVYAIENTFYTNEYEYREAFMYEVVSETKFLAPKVTKF
jgi:hypothetical protein